MTTCSILKALTKPGPRAGYHWKSGPEIEVLLQPLSLLSTFHYVLGGLAACCACFPLMHLAVGLLFLLAPESAFDGGDAPPPAMRTMFGTMFTIIPLLIILGGWIFAACVIYAGHCLAARRRYTFCLVMAALLCVFTPFGTVLGVLTIIVLVRPTVKAMFEKEAAGAGL